MDSGYGLGSTPGVKVSVGVEWTSSLYFLYFAFVQATFSGFWMILYYTSLTRTTVNCVDILCCYRPCVSRVCWIATSIPVTKTIILRR